MTVQACLPPLHAPSPLPADFAQPTLGLLGPCWPADFLPPLPLIFLDGGGKFRQLPYYAAAKHSSSSAYPQFLLGDGDSFPEGYTHFDVQLTPAKDFSDLAYALHILPPTVRQLYLCGLRGGRRDHELAVLGEVYQYLQTASPAHVIEQDFVGLPAGHHVFNFTGVFSILALLPTQITLTGHLAYPLPHPTVLRPLSSHGLSNEAFGRWEIEATMPFFLFFSQELPWPTT